MEQAYLCLYAHPDHPGLLRLQISPEAPPTAAQVGPHHDRLVYAALFNDSEAALMHAHEGLRHCLLDADTHLYRSPLSQAIGVIESLSLKHQRYFLQPELDAETSRQIEQLTRQLSRRRQRRQRWLDRLGYVALAALALKALGDLFGG